MQDIFPAAEKILSDVENIFKKNLNLSSFEIIPAEDNNKNKSPVYHEENSLGLASWCIRPLYTYVHTRLLDQRRNNNHHQHQQQQQHRPRREEPLLVSRWLLGALLLNPNVSTFWNMRRELARQGRLDPLEELRFVGLVLYHKAKCFEAFSYRRWILKLLMLGGAHHQEPGAALPLQPLLRDEIRVAAMAADRYRNNCYAWSHREQVMTMLLEAGRGTTPAAALEGQQQQQQQRDDDLLDSEWRESTEWCYRHVSEYSGFVYRQYLLKRLLLRETTTTTTTAEQTSPCKRRDIVLDYVKAATRGCSDLFLLHNGSTDEILELLHGGGAGGSPVDDDDDDGDVASAASRRAADRHRTLVNLSHWVEDCALSDEMIGRYPGHEALWYHRRFLVYCLLALNDSYARFAAYREESFERLLRQGGGGGVGRKKRGDDDDEASPRRRRSSSSNSSSSLLEVAFCSRNQLLIDAARRHGSQQNNLAEKFFNFAICMNLRSS